MLLEQARQPEQTDRPRQEQLAWEQERPDPQQRGPVLEPVRVQPARMDRPRPVELASVGPALALDQRAWEQLGQTGLLQLAALASAERASEPDRLVWGPEEQTDRPRPAELASVGPASALDQRAWELGEQTDQLRLAELVSAALASAPDRLAWVELDPPVLVLPVSAAPASEQAQPVSAELVRLADQRAWAEQVRRAWAEPDQLASAEPVLAELVRPVSAEQAWGPVRRA